MNSLTRSRKCKRTGKGGGSVCSAAPPIVDLGRLIRMVLKNISKILGAVNKAIEVFAVILFVLVMTCVLTQVFFRYVLKNPLVWIEELTRCLFIWMVFIGCSVAHQRIKHPKIDLFSEKLFVNRSKKVVKVGADIVMFAFLLLLFIYGANLAHSLKFIKLPTTKVSLLYLYISIPISALVMMLNQTVFIVRDFFPEKHWI